MPNDRKADQALLERTGHNRSNPSQALSERRAARFQACSIEDYMPAVCTMLAICAHQKKEWIMEQPKKSVCKQIVNLPSVTLSEVNKVNA